MSLLSTVSWGCPELLPRRAPNTTSDPTLFAQGKCQPMLYPSLIDDIRFVLTGLVQKQIPEQAQRLGITEEQVVKNVMLKDTVDGEFTTVGMLFIVP